jgi:hypothetical protein
LKLTERSGEFRKDEPRTPADVKEAEETLDDQKTLPAAFRGEDDEPEARRKEQNRTEQNTLTAAKKRIQRKPIGRRYPEHFVKIMPPGKTLRQGAKEEA